MDHNKLWKILKEMGIPDHLTFLLGYLYAEARSFEFDLFTVDIFSRVTPARLYRSRLDAAVQSSDALLGVIRYSLIPSLLGHGLGLCPKNLLLW